MRCAGETEGRHQDEECGREDGGPEGATAGSETGRDGAARQGGRAATSPRTSPAEVTRSCVPAAAGLPGPLRHPASRVPPGPRSRHCLDFRPPPDCLLPPPHFQGDLTWDVGNRALPLDWRGPLGLAPEWTCGSSCPAASPWLSPHPGTRGSSSVTLRVRVRVPAQGSPLPWA